MFSDPQLTELSQRRAALHARIARRRVECAGAWQEASRPLDWIDRGRERWRQSSPWLKLAVVPVGMAVARTVFGRGRRLGRALRWLPVATSLARAAFTFYRPLRQPFHSPQPPTYSS